MLPESRCFLTMSNNLFHFNCPLINQWVSAWGCLSSRVSDFLQSGKKSLHFIPGIWWPFKHFHCGLYGPVPPSPLHVGHIHPWHDCRWFLKQVLMWACLPSHYSRQTHSTKLTGRLALSDIKQTICLDSLRLFAQAARCSSGRWYSNWSSVCQRKAMSFLLH